MVEFEATPIHHLRRTRRLREIPAEDLCRGAQLRLGAIKQDETDGLAELRFGHQKWRVWGFLIGSTFDILWWDPNHTVCTEMPRGKRRK